MTTHGDGLRGVVVGESAISDVQPNGNLYYRGYNIHDLAEQATFEEVVYLLWHGDLPTSAQLDTFKCQIADNSALPEEVIGILRGFPRNANSMAALRTAVSALEMFDPDAGNNAPEANLRKAARLQAKMPTVVAAIERLSQGQEPIPPRPDLNLAGNFLYMLKGQQPDPLDVRTLDIDFILHADHELNASTFAARVTVSVQADLYSGIVTGIGTLAGPKHGGAAEETMNMLLEIGSVDRVDQWVRPKLTGEKRTPIPGFGHAVYRAPDPRATHLREMSRKLGELHNDLRWFQMTTAIEKLVDELSNTPERLAAGKQAIYANVDCFSASCYHEMGLPIRLYTPLFAISRTSGWCAHIMEQMMPGQRIIRPRAEYVGPRDRKWVPLGERR
ncbi:MAG TPA: citrate/2-methylcitrate synthase [Chthonomonadaceae bacterium]|nr:citrate/2-methylcitrate synthase [Chthonomonadaceae bacterium]